MKYSHFHKNVDLLIKLHNENTFYTYSYTFIIIQGGLVVKVCSESCFNLNDFFNYRLICEECYRLQLKREKEISKKYKKKYNSGTIQYQLTLILRGYVFTIYYCFYVESMKLSRLSLFLRKKGQHFPHIALIFGI